MRLNTASWNRLRYTLYAPFYDWALRRLPVFTRGRRRAVELASIQPGERVLLVACGTGLDLDLIPMGIHVVAVDITPAMIEHTRRRAAAQGREVDARVMDAARLELPDASFDCVMLHLALAVVPDPESTIHEAARVLVPGGRISVFDKFLPDDARPSIARRLAGLVTGFLATELNRQLGPLLRAAGLVLDHVEPVGLGGVFVAARAWRPR